MKSIIYSYALTMSFYDRGQDYIDSFLPFVLGAIKESGTIKNIQGTLKQNYGMEMPSHVVTNVLNRAKRKRFAECDKERYQLTSQGIHHLEQLETEAEVERRLNALIGDITVFFGANNTPITENTVAELLSVFVSENLQPLIEYINPDVRIELNTRKLGKYNDLLVRYIRDSEKQKPDEFHTIQDIVFGSIISTILYARQPADFDRLMKRFKRCQAFLDTNFIFSVLGLHTSEFNEPAEELLNLLKEAGFTIKAFDFTLNEMSRVLSSYPEEEHRYSQTVDVGSVCSALKKRGWTKTQVAGLIANLEEVLSEKGISVEWDTGVDLNTFEPEENEGMRALFSQYKLYYTTLSQNHDVAAIEKIKQYRRHPVRQIHHCKALFLSSDNGLSRLNFIGMGHKDNRTVSEVILDRLLTNILWLRNPASNLPIKSIIAAHSRGLFVQRRIWKRFYEILKNLREQGKVQDENISMLFYHGYIGELLRRFDDSETDQITEEFTLEAIEEAAKFKEEEAAQLMREQEEHFLKRLKETAFETVIQKDREWLVAINDSKASIRRHAEKSTGKRLLRVRAVIAVGLCVPFAVFLAAGDWSRFWQTISIVMLGLGVLQFLIPRLWDGVREKWLNDLYTARLKEARLDTFEKEKVSDP